MFIVVDCSSLLMGEKQVSCDCRWLQRFPVDKYSFQEQVLSFASTESLVKVTS